MEILFPNQARVVDPSLTLQEILGSQSDASGINDEEIIKLNPTLEHTLCSKPRDNVMGSKRFFYPISRILRKLVMMR